MANLFASRGVKATILTTPANAPLFQPSIDRANGFGHQNSIQLLSIPFPSGTGLPDGCENMSSVPMHLTSRFFNSMSMFRKPFARVLRDLQPDCVVTGTFLHWTYYVAAELGIPRLTFHGSNIFYQCATHNLDRYKPHKDLPREVESFIVPDLPHRIELRKSQIPDPEWTAPFLLDMFNQAREADSKSYGVVVNSFYELEPDYVDYYKSIVGRKAWHIGPMFLCNDATPDKSTRRNMSSIYDDTCLKWLDSKSPGSVMYVCFGSLSDLHPYQLRELALGLEASDRPFIWAMRKANKDAVPEEFEKRVGGRGLIIRGWAPQKLILNHPAMGGFLTHCGWNSCLEAITAGLPLITWPLFGDQTYNEKLIVDVLKIGIPIRGKDYGEEMFLVDATTIAKAVNTVMGEGEGSKERRRRVEELGGLARKAMEKDGSSYVDMSNLIQELKEIRKKA